MGNMNWLRTTILLTCPCFIAPVVARATVCDCKPEFPTESEGQGVCSKAKDDTKWCKTKFGTADTGPTGEHHDQFISALREEGLPGYDTSSAVRFLSQTPPEKWDLETIQTHVTAMFAVAIWDTEARKRLGPIANVLKKGTSEILDGIRGRGSQSVFSGYQLDVRRGCIQMTDKNFAVMLRFPFASPSVGGCGPLVR